LSHHGRSRWLLVGVAATGLLAAATAPVAASPQSAAALAYPTGARVVHTSHSSFTVNVHKARNARHYRLFTSRTKSDLYYADLTRSHPAAKASHVSTTPRLSVSGLHYTTAPYYYRVETLNGRSRRFSAQVASVGLRPSAPANVAVHDSASGLYLTWSNEAATGYRITAATDANLTSNVKTFTTRDATTQFTPYGLRPGTTYYFGVRALNDGTPSAMAPVVQAADNTREQAARVMTFNVLEATNDGRVEGGQHVAPWSKRVVAAAHLIRQGDPDVVGLQEAASWAPKYPVRQVDSLAKQLGGAYAIADTEIPPTQHHYVRTGVNILYKSSTYSAVGQGGHWDLGNKRTGSYQILRNKTTGATFLFVDSHLTVGRGITDDRERESQTKSLISHARDYAAAHNVPIVYAGDFNSHVGSDVALDGPGVAMRAAGVADGFYAAQSLSHQLYNSGNGYERRPPKTGRSIDHVYAPGGVAIESWKLLLDLSHGKFAGVMASDHNPLLATVAFPF
jgi:endonuclease/exonuclease/phosphatase family metal-dependent hydrolase